MKKRMMIGKRFLTIFVLFCFFLPLLGQRIIIMEKDGGVYKIPCSVNGAKMKFIFDTGAATVAGPEVVAQAGDWDSPNWKAPPLRAQRQYSRNFHSTAPEVYSPDGHN